MENSSGLTVTFCSPPSGEPAAMSAAFVQKIIGENAVMRHAPDLAGPNDMVQLLMHAAPWLVLYGLGKPFLESMLKEAGKDAWEAIKSKVKGKGPLDNEHDADKVMYLRVVFETLLKAREANRHVVLGFPIEERSFKSRSIGIELNEMNPVTFVEAIGILSNIGVELEKELLEYDIKSSEIENGDCSCAILINGDGSSECSFRSESAPTAVVTLRFDPSGKLV